MYKHWEDNKQGRDHAEYRRDTIDIRCADIEGVIEIIKEDATTLPIDMSKLTIMGHS